jgi:transcriptional regulator with XRE-family HTH domain
MNLIEDLKIFRLEKRMSQQKLANELGVAYQTVWRWFTGRTQPNQIQEFQIKKLLGK